MFHLGWAVGEDELFELVKREFLEIVIYSEEDRKGEPIWESIFCIPDGIIKDFNIPEGVSRSQRFSDLTASYIWRYA